MKKYYTRACNFYYGYNSKKLVKKNKSIPLNGNLSISFDHIEIITRSSKKLIHIKNINKLNKKLKSKIKADLNNIKKKKKNFSNFDFKELPNIMGILNLTPDSFSDGGKFNKKNKGYLHSIKMHNFGCSIIDIGGESTRPGSKGVNSDEEWRRISPTLKKLKKYKIPLSLDTRKHCIMRKGIKLGVKLINDVSALTNDSNSIDIVKKYNIPFVLHHMQGTPKNMQKKPKYKNVLLDIYDFFEKKIIYFRKRGILHNNIILDPGVGFGKNLKHNITLISNISLFHSLGFPILLGISRKKFIKDISSINDTSLRTGGTISATLYGMMQGVQIFRVHDVNEVIQSIRVFKKFIENK